MLLILLLLLSLNESVAFVQSFAVCCLLAQPGLLEAIREWYRTYKIPDGKPPNTFGLNEQFMGKSYAMSVIAECHASWEHLMSGEKERSLDDHSDHVKDLVRNLSKNSLLLLGGDLEIHEEAHGQDFGQEESGAVFF
jgi:hypothetical protein